MSRRPLVWQGRDWSRLLDAVILVVVLFVTYVLLLVVGLIVGVVDGIFLVLFNDGPSADTAALHLLLLSLSGLMLIAAGYVVYRVARWMWPRPVQSNLEGA